MRTITQYDLELSTEIIRRESARSLAEYLGHVVIDSRPEPRAWGHCWEAWQRALVRPLIPAVERMAGLRPEYAGPRSFFFVLPRGHDKTGLIGRIANWAIAFARRPIRAVAAAADLDQASLLLDSMRSEMTLNPWLGERLRPQKHVIHGLGGNLQVISADAASSSGLKSDLIILDELTFWRRRDLFDVLWSGREKRPDSVFLIITNAGLRGSWQHALLEKARSDSGDWHVFEAPPDATLASWMTAERIAAMRSLLPPGHARRVLGNHWIDVSDRPLIPFDLIVACEADCLWPQCHPIEGRADLYLGVDVGRTCDRTVIWTLELVGDVAWTREIKVLEGASFAAQKSEIVNRINKQVIALRIDKGGIGLQLAEELEGRYRGVAIGVQLNQGRQGQLALAFRTAFESHKIRIPSDPVLQADLQLVEEVATSTGGLPTVITQRGASGHADRFWAGALALSAIPLADDRKKPTRIGIRSVRSSLA